MSESDIVANVPQSRLEAEPVARLLDLIERPAFQADAGRIAGYHLSTAGHAPTGPTLARHGFFGASQ